MKTASQMPVVLTIAGSDSGGGAGIQADLKTFAALGVHGASAITCLTAQNPARVSGIEAASPRIVRQQMEAVLTGLPPAAVKTGMLYSAEIIRAVARSFRSPTRPPLVVDPVMVSTSGARLLQPAAIRELTGKLFPLATLITPNLDEAAVLLGRKPATLEAMRTAARELHLRFGCAVLMKGGHLRGQREAADIFFDGQTELLLLAPFIRGLHLHGTGCTYSAAIAGYLARGSELAVAVTQAKEFITRAIAGSRSIGKHTALVPS
ncbi:MAG TPA: bifunctional hydroxymethylpyrimidine kinase/phosphomethylpyrimidine kinase [Dongiaceae bacterium]|nr:bifunctional hydroxymethylpyrimidine kinase/phosphomethylpyrimidine kinase [Dongiaceae bacterium]